ncbi:O-antigen ligase family protein [Fusobacterium sp. MFO224]|uniref:O-antigen ligase family protein n=1 Tax=Fusobacterium sp. MFO224 TaxID=3378070 RepID=UPI0038531E97
MKLIEKQNFKERIIATIGFLYLFFLMRRGGDTKYIFSIILMGTSLFFIYKNKGQKILENKWLYISGMAYFILLTKSFSSNKIIPDRIDAYLGMGLYSVIFLLLCINIKVKEKYHNYFIPLISFFSLGSLYRGVQDIYINFSKLSDYRISGRTYTTIYAGEIGIYFFIGLISLFMYKKWYLKLVYIFYIGITLILIYFTKSRNAMLMIPITIGIVLIIKYGKKGLIYFSLILALAFGLVKYSNNINGLKRLSTLSSLNKIKKDARYTIFKEGLKQGLEKPLTGVGFKEYSKNNLLETESEKVPSFHNIYIETFATQGILNLIAYMAFIGCILIKLLKKYFKDRDIGTIIYIAVLIYMLLYGISEPIFYFGKVYQLLFTILTIGILKNNK